MTTLIEINQLQDDLKTLRRECLRVYGVNEALENKVLVLENQLKNAQKRIKLLAR